MRREVELNAPDDDGSVRYVEHYIDADGGACDEADATHFVGAYLNAEGETVRKAWGKVTRTSPPTE